VRRSAGSSDDSEDTKAFYLELGSVCNAAGAAATNWAVVAGGVSLSQVIKFAEPTATVLLTLLLLGEQTSASLVICVATASAGAYAAATAGTTSAAALATPHALACSAVMLAAFPLRNVCAKRAGASGPALYGSMSGRGSALFVPLALGRVLFGVAYAPPTALLAMAVLNATYNLASFRVLADVTAITHAQLRLGKRVFTLMISIMALRDLDLSPRVVAGLVVAVGGLGAYGWIKATTPKAAIATRPAVTGGQRVALKWGVYAVVVLLTADSAPPPVAPRPAHPAHSVPKLALRGSKYTTMPKASAPTRARKARQGA